MQALDELTREGEVELARRIEQGELALVDADEQLVARVREAMARDPALRVYFAQGGFRGLNGYYTSGVLEGAYHYGLFADAS